jgi:hypothetical protein
MFHSPRVLPGVWPIERIITKYTAHLSVYQCLACEPSGFLTIYASWIGVIS